MALALGVARVAGASSARVDRSVIGLLLPTDPTEAASLRQGALLGIEHANLLSGAKCTLVIRGRPGQWGTEGGEAALLALDDQASGLITPAAGTAAHEILQVAGRTQIPVASLCPDSSVTAAGVPWVLRVVPGNTAEARSILTGLTGKAAESSSTKTRWAALVPSERAGREAARDLDLAAGSVHCRLEPPMPVSESSGNDQTVADRVLASRPDGVLVWLDPARAGSLVHQLRRAGYRGFLAGPGRLECDTFVAAAGNAAENFIVPAVALDAKAETSRAEFRAEYQRRFTTEPDTTAAMAHDAALVLTHLSMKSTGQRPGALFPVREMLTGVSGTLRFDPNGNRLTTLRLMACRNGRFSPRPGD